MATNNRRSTSRFAAYKTESAAFRAGVTQAELSRSAYGRELIRRAESQRSALRKTLAANRRNQSFNYLIGVKRADGTLAEVTIKSDKRLNKTEIAREASQFFKAKKEHYGDSDTVGEVFPEDRRPDFSRIDVQRSYRGAVMRNPIKLR